MKYIGVATPAWTILGDKKRGKWKEFAEHPYPGPGNYPRAPGDRATFYQDPKWSFPLERRGKLQEEMVIDELGPGMYNVARDFDKSRSQNNLMKGKRIKNSENENIGFLVGSKRVKRLKKVALGPGSHDPIKITINPNQYSFGYKFNDTASKMNKLGPGQYRPSHTQQEFSKKSSFPIGTRSMPKFKKGISAPGPGHYLITGSMSKIRRRMKSRYTSTKGTFGTITKRRKRRQHSRGVPGVGKYDPDIHTIYYNMKKKKQRFGGSGNMRPVSNKTNEFDNDVPGPGYYKPMPRYIKPQAPGYSFGLGERERPVRTDNVDERARQEGQIKIMRKDRKVLEFIIDKENQVKRQTTFGKSKRTTINSTKAGGSMLNIRGNTNSAPKFSFKGHRNKGGRFTNINVPGPGSYYTENNFRVGSMGPNFRFGTGMRPEISLKRIGTPSPGEYYVQGDLALNMTGTRFGKGLRRPIYDFDPDVEVGPGTYDIKSTVPQLQDWEAKAQKEAAFKIALD